MIVEVASTHAANNILYCVLDGGVDTAHPDLTRVQFQGCRNATGTCKYPWDKDLRPQTRAGFGTFVTGIIAAGRNGFGVVGAVASGAHVFHYNVFGDGTNGLDQILEDQADGWTQCAAALDELKLTHPGAKAVVSKSYTYMFDKGDYNANLTSLYNRVDMLFVASSNDEFPQTNRSLYPASHLEVVSVAATNPSGDIAFFSNVGPEMEIAAPGEFIISTAPKDSLIGRRISMSSLHVSPALAGTVSLNHPPTHEIEGSGVGAVRRGFFAAVPPPRPVPPPPGSTLSCLLHIVL